MTVSLFDPRPNEQFALRTNLGERWFRAIAHPKGSGFVYAMGGAMGTVYRIRELGTVELDWALKVMKPKYRVPEVERICSALSKLGNIPGLEVCERQCLSPAYAPDTFEQYENLRYAILMPWIHGTPWLNVLALGQEGQDLLDMHSALSLARRLATVLSASEMLGIAHCDLSSDNVLVDLDLRRLKVDLIDVEDIFLPNCQQLKHRPLGTPGYRHRTSSDRHWGARGDRYSGAILIAEMLGWYNDEVRDISYGDSYFQPSEMQSTRCRRFDILAAALANYDTTLVDLLDSAWKASTVGACPSLCEWNRALQRVKLEKTQSSIAR